VYRNWCFERLFGLSFLFYLFFLSHQVLLSKVFTRMEKKETILKYGITDWAITETSLDQCFLKVARRVHMEEDGMLVRRVGHSLSEACQEEIY
jgi:hypothetical protein